MGNKTPVGFWADKAPNLRPQLIMELYFKAIVEKQFMLRLYRGDSMTWDFFTKDCAFRRTLATIYCLVPEAATLTSTSILASTYRNQSRWEEAEDLEVQAIETSKSKLGVDYRSILPTTTFT